MAEGVGVDRHFSRGIDYAQQTTEGERQLMSYFNGTTQCTESA